MADFSVKQVPMFPTRHAVVTPSDTVDLAFPSAIFVMATGNVAVQDKYGVTITYTSVPAFSLLPVTAARVMATNTTVGAGNIIALYGEGTAN